MKRLQAIASKKSRVVVGLMSGTSHDGVDAAVARIDGSGPSCRARLIRHVHTPYTAALRAEVARAFNGPTELVCRLNFELGEFFAAAALEAIAEAGLTPGDVDIIGSHGQTVHHVPPADGAPGSTLQIGEGAVIARRTGVLTVSDFRTADVAAGGHGAPLAPLGDWVLFRRPGEVLAVLNIGGVASVSVVTERLDGVTGFDIGPGNSLIDETVKIVSGGELAFDISGNIAISGRLIPDLLDNLMAYPYFRKKPPKTTGRELFGREMAKALLNSNPGVPKEDMLATLTHFTARSVRRAFDDFILPGGGVDGLVLCGGGAKNEFLVSLIRGLFPGVRVVFSDELGVPDIAREALIFAVLAGETLTGNPGNVPAATGAGAPAVLGKISF